MVSPLRPNHATSDTPLPLFPSSQYTRLGLTLDQAVPANNPDVAGQLNAQQQLQLPESILDRLNIADGLWYLSLQILQLMRLRHKLVSHNPVPKKLDFPRQKTTFCAIKMQAGSGHPPHNHTPIGNNLLWRSLPYYHIIYVNQADLAN